MGFSRAKRSSQSSIQGQQISTPPEVTSCAKGIRVVKVEILRPGSPDASVAAEIENLSDAGVVAVAMEATTPREAYMVSRTSSLTEGKPAVVLENHRTMILEMPLTNIFPDAQLKIGGVFYADGREEGCGSALETMREYRDEEKKKGKPPR
jgi:hypothetical protein